MRKAGLVVAIIVLMLGLASLLSAQLLAVTPSQTGRWAPTKDMSQARTGAAAIAMSDGSVLVTGGVDESGTILSSAEVFAAGGTFKSVAPMNVPRTGHTATWLKGASGTGRYVLVTGGTSTGGVVLATAELYDPAANTWAYSVPMSEARSGHPAAALPNSSVLVSGGANSYGLLSSAELFSLSSQQFMFGGALQPARKAHAAAALKDGRVLLVGGTDADGNTLASTAIFDSTTGAIYSGPSLNTPRAHATATTLLDGTVLIAGGSYPEGAVTNGGVAELQSAEIFDPVAGTMTPAATRMMNARAGHQAFLLPNNNNVLLVGGIYNGTDLATAELYIPWTGQFTATGAMSVPRSSATGAVLFPMVDGQLLVAGGSNQKTGELYGFATIKTDAADYAPGTPVLMSGAGWKPLETVSLFMRALPQSAGVAPVMTTTADADGKIFDGTWAPDNTDLGALFYLTAVGGTSGAQAQNTFTDSFSNVACSPSTVAIGSSTTCTATGNGNSENNSVVDWSVTAGGAGTFTPASCTIAGSTCAVSYTPTSATGTTQTIQGSIGGSNKSTSLTVGKGTPTVTWSTAPPSSAAYNSQFTVVATSNSTGAITYSVTGGCSNVGGTVTMTSSATACAVTANVAADTNYSAGSVGPTSVTAIKATPTVAWSTAPPASAAYNTVFTVVATTNSTGTITYGVSGGCSNVGGTVTMTSSTTACAVTANVAADTNYSVGSVGPTSVTATKATPTVAWSTAPPVSAAYNSQFTVVATTNSTGTITYGVSGGCSNVGGAVTMASSTTACAVTANVAADTNYVAGTVGPTSVTATKASATPTLNSAVNPSVFGQAVGLTATLPSSATGNVTFKDGSATLGTGTIGGGTASYSAAALAVGSGHSITAVYGGDSNYNTGTSIVLNQTVNQASSSSSVTSSGPSTYDQAVTFTATVSAVAPGSGTPSGTVTFKDGVTTLGSGTLSSGQASYQAAASTLSSGSHSITAVYGADANFAASTSAALTQTVNKATPIITTAPTASGITYGQTLASSTLSGGVASVGGSFAFTTPTTVPGAGTATQGVTFAPTDTTNYNTVSLSVSVTVAKATPTITTLPTASGISYGQTLSASTLNGGAGSVAGGFTFTTPATVPGAESYSASVTFTPTDTTNYNTVSLSVSVAVAKATPTITTLPTASGISYGQTLASSTLSGGAGSVGGGFTFTTPATVPGAGNYSASVTFTPTDVVNYNTVSLSVSVTVAKATPTITTLPTASGISYGQTLSASTLNGGAGSVGGGFTFTTPATVPGAGNYSASVTFTPTDVVNYNTATGSVTVVVAKATPTITTLPTASGISYGQTLSASTLSGGAGSVGGVFSFTTPATVPGAGTATQGVTFTSTDSANYSTASGSVTVAVAKATPTITTLPTASGIGYGQTLSASTLSGGAGSVAGGFTFTTPATVPGAGNYSAPVTFTPTDSANYNTASGMVTVAVAKATPTITTLPTASGISYGQTLSASTLSGGAGSVAGGFTFTIPATAPGAGTAAQSVTFIPTDTTNYNTVSGVVDVTVGKATATVTLGGLSQTFDGTGKTATASTSPADLAVIITYNGLPTAPTAAGSYAVLATVSDANYQGTATGTLTIAQATSVVTLSNLSQTYNGAPRAATITTTPSPLGVAFSYTGIDPTNYPSSDVPPTEPGSYAVVATVFDTNYIGQAIGTLTINKLDPALQFALRTGMPEQTPYGTWVYFDLGMAKTPCPTGTVQFYVDGQATGSAVVLNGSECSQAVEFKTATLLAGAHNVNAVYSGDAYYVGNTSGTVSHDVIAGSTTVALAASGQILNVGQTVTFTATVTPAAQDGNAQTPMTPTAQDGNAQAPSGTVQFFDGEQPIGGAKLLTTVSPYTATLTISSLPAGTHNITAQYTSADGLYAGSSSAVALNETVNTISPTITWGNPASIVYGTKLGAEQLNATATNDGTSIDGMFTYNPPADTVLPVGQLNLQVTFTPADTATYSVQTATATINVTAATLTVKADDASRVYGTENPALTYKVSGFVNNDSMAAVGGSASCSTLADAGSPVAGSPYAITCKQDTLTADNYKFNFVDGSLTVDKAPLTVTATNASKTYGAVNPMLDGTLTGVLDGDNITAGYDTTAATASPVGSYTITATLSDPNHKLDNYTVTNTPGTLTISESRLTVGVQAATKVYGAANPVFVATYSGFVNGDSASVLNGALSYSTLATAASGLGSYSVTPGGVTSNNYIINFTSGSLAVTPAVLAVTASNASRVYGTANPALTYAIAGFVNGDPESVVSGVALCSTTAAVNSPAGATYPITCLQGGLSASNYVFNMIPGTLTVSAVTLTIGVQPSAKTYGSANPVFTATYSGFVNNDTAAVLGGTLQFNTTAGTSSGVGSYAVTPSGVTSNSYVIAFTNGTLTVNPAVLTVAANNLSRAFGVANPALTYAITGFVNGDSSTAVGGVASCSTTATFASVSGGYPINCAPGTLTASNYSFTFVPGTLTVAAPDLVETTVKLTGSPISGGSIQVTDTVLNQGATTASASQAGFYVSFDGQTKGTYIGSRSLGTLAAGASSTATTTVTLPTNLSGTFYIIACADYATQAVEGNEDNNCLTSSAMTIAIPDLKETEISNLTATPLSGGAVQISETVQNQGTGNAGASSTGFYLSVDGVAKGTYLGARSVGALIAGAKSAAVTTITLPKNLNGTYYILGCADYGSQVVESNEANNCIATGAMTLGPADLVETAITVLTGTPVAGGSLQVSDTVKNQGVGNAGSSISGFYLSIDGTTKGTLLGSNSVAALNASGSVGPTTTTVTLPTNLNGSYYVIACADISGQIAEASETNNCTTSGRISVLPADLAETTVTVLTSAPVAGGSIQVSDTVTNQGSGNASASTTAFYLSMDGTTRGSSVGSRPVSAMIAGGSSAATTTVTLPNNLNGNYYLIACADSSSQVSEANEGNNCAASAQFKVLPADLVEDTVSILTTAPTSGGSLQISDTVLNLGSGNAGASVTGFYLSMDGVTKGTYLGSRSVVALSAGGSSGAVTTTLTLAASVKGTYYVMACADSNSAISEANETNNCKASTVTMSVN